MKNRNSLLLTLMTLSIACATFVNKPQNMDATQKIPAIVNDQYLQMEVQKLFTAFIDIKRNKKPLRHFVDQAINLIQKNRSFVKLNLLLPCNHKSKDQVIDELIVFLKTYIRNAKNISTMIGIRALRFKRHFNQTFFANKVTLKKVDQNKYAKAVEDALHFRAKLN